MAITRGHHGVWQPLLERGEGWEAPPQQNGDFMNSEVIKEIMTLIFPEYPVSGPNKTKFPEDRALYDEISKALKAVRYEKGYEDPETHQPQLDIYFQALSRGKEWRRKKAVTL